MRKDHFSFSALFCLLFAGFLSGCQLNVFDPLDSPSGDQQLVSAARACFDRGDLLCARDLYGQLSGDSATIRESELAFALLDESGASIGEFMHAFGAGDGGRGFTRFANSLIRDAGAGKRARIFSAWQKTLVLPNDPELRGIVRFVSAAALAAAVLAETASTAGDPTKFTYEDLVTNPTICQTLVQASCNNAACGPPSAGILTSNETGLGSTGLDASGARSLAEQANPSLALLDASISEIAQALSNGELGASGKFGTGTGGTSNAILNSSVAYSADGSASRRCYRWLLINNGIGLE